MYRVLVCLTSEHDWRLLVLAAGVCLLTGFAAIQLLERVKAARRFRALSVIAAGSATAFGVWSTHFIAILAYRPGLDLAFDIPLTALSLIVGAAFLCCGFGLIVYGETRFAAPLGGATIGLGAAAKHYIGMAALQVPADPTWTPLYVVASVAAPAVLAAAALTIAQRGGRFARFAAGAMLGLAVWALHFVSMAGLTLIPDPARAVGSFSFDPSTLAFAIAAVAIAALWATMTAAFYDRRLADREAEFAAQRATLARDAEAQLRERNAQLDAALNNMSQALCMFDGERRLTVCNARYAEIFNLPAELTRPGTPIFDILKYRVAQGMYPGEDGEAHIRSRLEIADRNVPTKSFLEFRDGRIFSVLHMPMAGGGWVATHEDVTEQVRAQRALKEAQATLIEARAKAERAAAEAQRAHQGLLEACNLMDVGLVLFDAEDRLALWNRRYAELHYGDAADSLRPGASFEELIRGSQQRGGREYGDEAERAEWRKQRLARHRLPENSEEIRLPDNRWIKVDERRTADGGSIGVRTDITDLKRREESFRLLFEANPVPMWLFDNETGQFLAVNDAAVQHYGYSRERFLEMSIFDIRPVEERAKVRSHMASPDRPRQDGEVWRHVKADGGEIDASIYSRVMNYNGRDARLVAAVDVTKAQRAEAEARRAREFLDVVFENVPAPIIVKDALDRRMVLVNRAAEEFIGLPRAELIGKTSAEIYSREEGALLADLDRAALESGREVVMDGYKVATPGNGVRFVASKRVPILDQAGAPTHLVTVINDITERKRADERIAHLSTHDSLTGLANREAFARQLAEALARGGQRGVAALCIDLDRFKEINEIQGYKTGDGALQAVARRLQKAATEAFIARVGGDEFNLVICDSDQPAAVMAMTERIFAAFAEEIEIENVWLKIGLSIGVAISPADGADAATLLANAEAALGRAKREGRGVARFFEAEMDSKLRERRSLRHELNAAIALGQLRVHYQPQANMAGEIFGFEALARWRHPSRGFVPPGLFIPIAEESGAIKQIGEWILRQACREAASWPRPLTVSVNLSSVQFRQADLIETIQSALIEAGLPGHRLELEITESALIDDPDSARAILRRIKALGVRIAMDDFGTGYSSLSYLQSFPFDKIKIDRSFIVGLGGNSQAGAIIRAVIGLAHGLDLAVIAEGVETKEQMAFLMQEKCDEMQGYLVGRPEPIEDYARVVGRSGGRALRVVA